MEDWSNGFRIDLPLAFASLNTPPAILSVVIVMVDADATFLYRKQGPIDFVAARRSLPTPLDKTHRRDGRPMLNNSGNDKIGLKGGGARLWQLIEDRTRAGADKEAIDRRIWDLFGEDRAVRRPRWVFTPGSDLWHHSFLAGHLRTGPPVVASGG